MVIKGTRRVQIIDGTVLLLLLGEVVQAASYWVCMPHISLLQLCELWIVAQERKI